MKRALIATLYNEADNVARWWGCLSAQTVRPDEIALVDGGSTDGTWEKLQAFARSSPVPVRLLQQRCNIAAGRNRAIEMTAAEIIASSDAGSFPDPNWFGEITRPLLEDQTLDVVGGRSVATIANDFQKLMQQLDPEPPGSEIPDEVYPSSRNIAFRRAAWADVGGYPEWLTLTAEDALFNFQLHKIGKRFAFNSRAVVPWPVREDMAGYRKMLYTYGYGAAEARLYAPYFRRRLLLTLCPPLLLLSRHRFRHFGFRYRKNAASATGWIAGFLRGRRAPSDWRRFDGVLLSPQAQRFVATAAGGQR
jgi:glycosyltransferase involved in cell wall biosynthesis